VVLQNVWLALLVVLAAMGAAFLARKKAMPAAAGRSSAKGGKTSWVANCPKCKNLIKSKEVECGNCGEADIRVVGGQRPRLKCGHCESPANNPACPNCQTVIAAKFWR
jgi:cytochrome c553